MLSNSDAALPLHPPPGIRSFASGFSVAEVDPLRQSEARFRALAQATGQIYWVADKEGHLTDAISWCAFTGLTPEEAACDGWATAVHPDDHEQVLADWATAFATRQPFRHEHRVRRVDGQYRLMLAQAYPVLDADGTVSEWVGVNTDITLLQELRTEAQTSQEEFQATFEQAAVGITHVRPDGRILRANQKFCEMLGYSREELLGRSFQELTYPPDLAANLTLLEQLLAGAISTYTLEKRYLRKDGSLVWVNLTASLKRDQAGRPHYGIAVVENISTRKAAEEALRRLEEELQGRVQELETIFASMHDGLIVFGADGQVLRTNPAYSTLVGWSEDSALHEMSWEERRQTLRIRDSQGAFLALERLPLALILQGETLAEEHILRSRDGRDVVVSVRGSPLTDTAGRVTGAVLVLHDITERLRLESHALELVNQLEAMFTAIADGVAIYDLSGRVIRANPAYHALLGAPASPDHYSLPFEERYRLFQVRDEQGHLLSDHHIALEELLRGESASSQGVDLHIKTLDGRDREINVTGGPLKDEAGAVVGAVVVYHDVTTRRQLEQQTQEALKALLRMAELLVQYPSGRKEQALPMIGRHLAELACSILGCSVATIITLDLETLGMGVLATVGYTSVKEAQLHSIISAWSYKAADLGYITRLMAGETLVLDVTEPPYKHLAANFDARQVVVAPMLLGGHLIGMVVFHPSKATRTFTNQQIALAGATAQLVGLVVERERLLHEREEARARALVLQESNRQMETFLGMVSHELRTPLASMMWSLQSINLRLANALFDVPAAESSLHSLLKSLQEVLMPAQLQVVQLERLVKDLLDDARIKEGKLELRLSHDDLGVIVQKVVAEQRKLTPDRLIEVYTRDDQALLVQVDSDRIRQAVMNYLSNALIYSPPTTPVLVGVEQVADQVRVWVRDQGPGIPPAEQERVWERFYRVPGITEQHGPAEGLGLGLYVTKMLIEGHRGQVGMLSTPGQGTTFWFTLPLASQERCDPAKLLMAD